MSTIPDTTSTADLFVYGSNYGDGNQHVIVTGLEPQPNGLSREIRLTTDDAYALGQQLIFWSGKNPVVKKRQEVSDSIRALAGTVEKLIERAPRLQLDPDGRALSQDVLAAIAAEWDPFWHPLRNWKPTANSFGRALRVLGHESVKSHGERYYTGLSIVSDADQLSPDADQSSADDPSEGGSTGQMVSPE